MQGLSLEQVLLQAAFSIFFCLLFYTIGKLLLAVFLPGDGNERNGYADIFYAMLSGMMAVVVLYSTIFSAFRTINILLPAAFFCLKGKMPVRPKVDLAGGTVMRTMARLALPAIGFVLLINFLPESEYKQKDSFFYLKISEALTLTGQENANNYYNTLDGAYHGVEWYHYFELWLNAFLLRITHYWLPNIQAFRIVCYSVLSVVFLNGLFHVYEVITGQKIRIAGLLFCIAFLFFMPDIFSLLPAVIRRLMTFNFENNYLERPNFRIIYLFFLPVLTRLWQKKYDEGLFFFLLCLCIVHPAVFLGLVPAIFLLSVTGWKHASGRSFAYRKGLYIFFLFVALYGIFYLVFRTKGVPAMYHTDFHDAIVFYKRSYRYVILTIFSSLLYCALLAGAAVVLFRYLGGTESREQVIKNRGLTTFFVALTACCIVVARVLGYLENLYQVAYTAYIVVSLFIFILFALVVKRGRLYALPVIILTLAGYAIFKTATFHTQGRSIFYHGGGGGYGGVTYSAGYLAQVNAFMKEAGSCAGGYLADSSYYRPLYYSNRNPAVYHLPLTYIIANNVTSNIDYCLSDQNDILYDGTGALQHNVYLGNGIDRSYYHWFKKRLCAGQPNNACATAFALQHRLKYLILTRGIAIDSALSNHTSQVFTDSNTGERFLVLR